MMGSTHSPFADLLNRKVVAMTFVRHVHFLFVLGAVLLLLGPVDLKAQGIDVDHEILKEEGPTDPWAKMLGDIDGDGRVDAVIGGRNGPLVWYENPDWERHFVVEGGYDTVDGEVGDIDGDGDLDVVMGGLFWYENPRPDRDASWKVHQIAEHGTHDVELADFDGDGRTDVATREQSEFGTNAGNKIYVWLQKKPDEWTRSVISCPHGEGIDVSDLDGDGHPDIVIGGIWFENGGTSKTQVEWQRHRFASWHPNASVAVADVDSDGRDDVVLTPAELEDEYYRISWFEAPPSRTDSSWTEHVIAQDVEAVYHSLALADLNLDGQTDVVTAEMHQSEDPDEVVVYVNQERGATWTKQVLSKKGSHLLQVKDIDGDGDPDIMGANWSGDYQPIELWRNMEND